MHKPLIAVIEESRHNVQALKVLAVQVEQGLTHIQLQNIKCYSKVFY